MCFAVELDVARLVARDISGYPQVQMVSTNVLIKYLRTRYQFLGWGKQKKHVSVKVGLHVDIQDISVVELDVTKHSLKEFYNRSEVLGPESITTQRYILTNPSRVNLATSYQYETTILT